MSNQPKIALGDTDTSILQAMQEINAKRAQGDFNNSLPRVEAFIPKEILINCPQNKKGMVRAMNCRSCLHFDGIVQTSWDNERQLPWHIKYAIRCGAPLERKCVAMIEES